MNDNYDRAPAALEAEVSRGLTQSGFINRVFGWMTAGLALTGAISYGIAHSSMSEFVLANQGTYLLLILLELGVVIGLSAAINRLSATVADRSIPTTSCGPGGLLRRDLFFKP